MKISAVIIEDEPNNLENLQAILTNWCPAVQVVGTAATVAEAIAVINTQQPQLLFLDIQLEDRSGFEVLKGLDHLDFEVVFVTAYDQYGIQAIKFSALDYLLKPIDIRELQQAVEKAREKIMAKQHNGNLENLLNFVRRSGIDMPRIALPTLQETRYVKVNEILRCEASNNYTNFHLRSGETILVCKTLKEFAELLKPYDFHRTHQSHLVNLPYVKSLLREDGGVLLMEDGAKVPVSRQNMESIKQALNRHS
ncbi:DNA-binding response regulator [Paraflavitalea soli]|uniref:DNA-binding response regulator n=1 Tax=Paraflavitalea soli TaxID=2315862 RepID=A0A3B7MI39_9BACT|nr:LytTR family DNA-binding domain-containing protein [Paraflavitalea soli]AXY72850.1 DNA-binding response regulator [Paraflavitalea soli]